jgi:hypothetical protein
MFSSSIYVSSFQEWQPAPNTTSCPHDSQSNHFSPHSSPSAFLPINGQPTNDDLICLSDAILPIVLKAAYDRINGIHNLWGLVASADCYLNHYGAPFVCPATRLACYNPAITVKASRVDRICSKTTRAALLQDCKAYKAAERGVKVFIKAVVNGFGTFVIPRRFTPTLQPSTS